MDPEVINALRELFEEYSNTDSAVVTAAYLTVGGMLCVSILGLITQLFITKRIVTEEHRRLLLQLNIESRARQHEKWESDILESVTSLIKSTDPEINANIDPAVVTSHVLKVQILLNENDPNQAKVNSLVTELALTTNGWIANDDPLPVLKIQGQLLEAAKLLIYRPM